jgi:LmbE family N-acetylglucosaminyl deacetylase
MKRMAGTLVISPHYDDAVLSCGHWLGLNPGAIVSTVCSGFAGPGVGAGPWDETSGFVTADQATGARQAEDVAALGVLIAIQGPRLGFLDNENRRQGETLAGLEQAIGALLDHIQPERCLVPLGVAHPDHIATGVAAHRAVADRPNVDAIVYADLPYRFVADTQTAYDEALVRRVSEEGFRLVADVERLEPSTEVVRLKRIAAMRYGSQVWRLNPDALERSFGRDAEIFWHIEPASS